MKLFKILWSSYNNSFYIFLSWLLVKIYKSFFVSNVHQNWANPTRVKFLIEHIVIWKIGFSLILFLFGHVWWCESKSFGLVCKFKWSTTIYSDYLQNIWMLAWVFGIWNSVCVSDTTFKFPYLEKIEILRWSTNAILSYQKAVWVKTTNSYTGIL